MTSLSWYWKRSLLSISALLFFAYLVSSHPFPPFRSSSSPSTDTNQLRQPTPPQRQNMPNKPSKMSIHPSTDLEVSISSTVAEKDATITINSNSADSPATSAYLITLDVKVENTADHPISILKWNSPLDRKAGLLGVFQVRDTSSASHSTSGGEEGTLVPMDTIKFSRKLPPPPEDMLEIAPGQTIESRVTLPPINLEAGKQTKEGKGAYSVRAEGRWQAIWRGGVDEISGDERTTMVEQKKGGAFKSADVAVDVQ